MPSVLDPFCSPSAFRSGAGGCARRCPYCGRGRRCPYWGRAAAEAGNSESRARITKAFGKLPLYFIENRGQLDSRVAYYVQGRDTGVFFTSRGVTFALTGHRREKKAQRRPRTKRLRQPAARQRYALRLDFVGADPAVRPTGTSPTPAVVSYFGGCP